MDLKTVMESLSSALYAAAALTLSLMVKGIVSKKMLKSELDTQTTVIHEGQKEVATEIKHYIDKQQAETNLVMLKEYINKYDAEHALRLRLENDFSSKLAILTETVAKQTEQIAFLTTENAALQRLLKK